MKQKVIAILLAVVILMILPAGLAAAKTTTTHEINLTLNGQYSMKDARLYVPPSTNVPATVTIGGELKEKNGNWYLSPLTGNIEINDVFYEIVVKPLNHPQPINYYLYYETPEQKSEQWYCVAEVNIEEDKYTGWLWFTSQKYYNQYQGQSQLYFQGIVDGEIATFNPRPPYLKPEIQ